MYLRGVLLATLFATSSFFWSLCCELESQALVCRPLVVICLAMCFDSAVQGAFVATSAMWLIASLLEATPGVQFAWNVVPSVRSTLFALVILCWGTFHLELLHFFFWNHESVCTYSDKMAPPFALKLLSLHRLCFHLLVVVVSCNILIPNDYDI